MKYLNDELACLIEGSSKEVGMNLFAVEFEGRSVLTDRAFLLCWDQDEVERDSPTYQRLLDEEPNSLVKKRLLSRAWEQGLGLISLTFGGVEVGPTEQELAFFAEESKENKRTGAGSVIFKWADEPYQERLYFDNEYFALLCHVLKDPEFLVTHAAIWMLGAFENGNLKGMIAQQRRPEYLQEVEDERMAG